MNPDLDTLATRLYVTVDDLLVEHPEWVPERPAVGIAPRLGPAVARRGCSEPVTFVAFDLLWADDRLLTGEAHDQRRRVPRARLLRNP